MTTPANLVFARDLTVDGHPTWEVKAFQIVDNPWTAAYSERDVSLGAATSMNQLSGNGTGAVGQFVLFLRRPDGGGGYQYNSTVSPFFYPSANAAGWTFDPWAPPPPPPGPHDPNAPAVEVDTTVGGGSDYTPGSDDPAYRAPGSGQVNEPLTDERETDTLSGGTDVGRTGNTDSHLADPRTNIGDTTVAGGGAGGIGRVGDVDPHTKDPVDYSTRDTTQIGGGVAASSTGQAYRAPSDPPPASTFETAGRAGTLSVNPGSPDAAVVGNASGLNPNAVEPTFQDPAYYGHTTDTTNAGAPSISPVPAATGTPLAPGTPTVAAIAGRAACHVTWTAPANAVATGVVAYVVVSNTGGETEVGKNSLTVEFEQGLVPGDTYTFQVFARTSNGTGPRSAASLPFTVPKADNILPDTERDEGL